MPALPSGSNWVVGGVVGAILLPVLALGAAMPFWMAVLISAVAGCGTVAVVAPRQLFARLDASGAARGKIEFARELLTEAEPLTARLEEAAASIRTPKIAAHVRHLVTIARDIFAAIEKDPLRVDRIRRFLTYYLPRAAEIAEAYDLLERHPIPDGARIAATSELIDRLDLAFTRYAASLQDADLDKLDIELKLLKSALDEDLGPASVGASSGQGQGRS
ncbi:5-bromo-4-chloroindolyl phosphate hydrolysis family protein [Bradyrhizobium sp. U87765 SZCCT0131]|uniref:5-bromo-4-chloroindolyl phosphate hydrolysis family protein n=1 Tax=unclassified Bradyrhizobium TaxID=2631580 RepID=UPI001BACDE60|nr:MULTISPECIES: 5-bromo-4-chloroindolyl phosphate hydrolysis family protein [unclassified Bradyrhizobium]MBR1219639.1 5-bromo-4-chloroindolyl phosphate hydrolysis family protein [Bradyrhizobium sp. U87765 SZCCT0131]MBR1262290.1 5-bromo-4-chloroindolyl phosphate hydrolysis family protein [Bradyrhizobium sp. U87765 SZCCT0134]MBR1308527.1 5-bromo-4-chloroindolyl phosphate hydrolysis family protein [Bradyrhizobium sp. U87765 SZCCT0110]MBR1318072.1 5-bromo-4-chloroindolyl phosphate hydrolysis famil